MKTIKLYLIAVSVLSIIVFACKKQQPQMSEDIKNPCDCAHEVSADFKMETTSNGNNYDNLLLVVETDTAYGPCNIWFTAKEEDAEYTWYVGAEVIHEKQFHRYFDQTLIGQTLPMTLVVKKNPNTKCYPNDDGYDSITKFLTIVQQPDELDFYYNNPPPKWVGTYRMKDENYQDSIDIVTRLGNGYYISEYTGNLITVPQTLVIYNVPEAYYDTIFFLLGTYTYRKLFIDGNFCYGSGYFSNQESNKYELYIPGNATSSCKSYHFYGRKIN